jgi:hypothetical protein
MARFVKGDVVVVPFLMDVAVELRSIVKTVKAAKVADVSGKWPNRSTHEFLWPVRHKIVVKDCSS